MVIFHCHVILLGVYPCQMEKASNPCHFFLSLKCPAFFTPRQVTALRQPQFHCPWTPRHQRKEVHFIPSRELTYPTKREKGKSSIIDSNLTLKRGYVPKMSPTKATGLDLQNQPTSQWEPPWAWSVPWQPQNPPGGRGPVGPRETKKPW